MKDLNFSRWNKILGWTVFAIALYTYASTVEPTVSFWDPGEYIATSAKLEVGHPPGAPLFQMIGAVSSMFAIDDAHIALMVNLVSVLSSALTILLMFWSISLLVRKISGPAEKLSPGGKMAVLGSALVGSLAFAFTDSFWFSAVEAEVYAMAMFFMSALFYVGLLWERDMLKPRGNRWLILLSLLVGLTFGVHFLGLLTIPAIGYMYYFKHTKKITAKNFIIATVVVIGVLLFIFKLLLPYSMTFFSASELFFVNFVGLPFNSGTIIAGIVLIALFYYGLRYTRKKGMVQLNTIILCILFIFIGFSSWLMLPIRANAGTNINENNPDNARQLLAYYNREQYPKHALFYGPQFTATFAGLDAEEPYIDGKPKYEKNEKLGKYVVVNNWKDATQNFSDTQKAFLPRMWSMDHDNMVNYMNITGPVEYHLKPEYYDNAQLQNLVQQVKKGYQSGKIDNDGLLRFLSQYGQYLNVEKPSTAANFQFLFKFQIWYMYVRYFMWNFVGRQNDKRGQLTNMDGNWLSGIPAVDSALLRPQANLPDEVMNNPARNTYFFLPLILGLIGLFFQFDKDKRGFWVIMVLFLFTGLALKIYLNERAFEPRERDYALVGSFYAFSLWIGFGLYSLYDKLKKYLKPKILAPILTVVCVLAVPVVMAQQNWNDHDRSNKRTADALAKNYLDSTLKNSILFTVGDNDTFPLWYAQEVEGYREDVRIINTSLFATEWYISQMHHKMNDSQGIKTTLGHKDYVYGTNDVIIYKRDPRMPDTMTVKNWLLYIKSNDPSTKISLANGHTINTFPTKHLKLMVNKENVLKSGIVSPKDKDKIVSYIPINIDASQITKNVLLMLDAVANTDWKRPVFFSGGSYDASQYLWMKDYLELEGLCYQLVPIKTPSKSFADMGRIDTDRMYPIVMNWHWGNSGDPDMYYDPETRKNAISYRSNMARLVAQLIKQKEFDKAENVLDLGVAKMPLKKVKYYSVSKSFVVDYYKIGKPKKARKVAQTIITTYQQWLAYYIGVPAAEQQQSLQDIMRNVYLYRDLVRITMRYDSTEKSLATMKKFNSYVDQLGNLFQDIKRMKFPIPQQKSSKKKQDSTAK